MLTVLIIVIILIVCNIFVKDSFFKQLINILAPISLLLFILIIHLTWIKIDPRAYLPSEVRNVELLEYVKLEELNEFSDEYYIEATKDECKFEFYVSTYDSNNSENIGTQKFSKTLEKDTAKYFIIEEKNCSNPRVEHYKVRLKVYLWVPFSTQKYYSIYVPEGTIFFIE